MFVMFCMATKKNMDTKLKDMKVSYSSQL
uniref:Uncharacterized protein n=1 Tax=Anopheles albimanus TaxID=7167 RepID=A0A182FX42_ANOAL